MDARGGVGLMLFAAMLTPGPPPLSEPMRYGKANCKGNDHQIQSRAPAILVFGGIGH